MILLTGNELHMTFKIMKAEMYVQKLLDFILHQFETARRKKKFKIHPNPHNPYETSFIFVSFLPVPI